MSEWIVYDPPLHFYLPCQMHLDAQLAVEYQSQQVGWLGLSS